MAIVAPVNLFTGLTGDFFIYPCGVSLCQGFVVEATDARRCGYDRGRGGTVQDDNFIVQLNQIYRCAGGWRYHSLVL